MRKRKLIAVSALALMLGGCVDDPRALLADTDDDSQRIEVTPNPDYSSIERDMEKYEGKAEIVTRGSSSQSVIRMNSEDVTLEFLDDWYKNYVGAGRCDAYVILYTDQDHKGVFATGSLINVGSDLEELSDGMIRETDVTNAVTYIGSDTEDLILLQDLVENSQEDAAVIDHDLEFEKEDEGCAASKEHCN